MQESAEEGRSGMELRHLRYFAAVAELRNFTRAAERSFVAQSALSQQIGRLEQELGAALFVRGNRRVDLTPAGELLLPYALRTIAAADGAAAAMRSYLGLDEGALRLGMIQTSASAIDVLEPIRRFHDRHPRIDLRVVSQTSTEMVHGVQAGALDLAVVGVSDADVPEGLVHEPLATDPLVGVVASAAAEGLREPLELQELLARGPLISFAAGTGIRRHVDEALVRAGIAVRGAIEVSQAIDMLRFTALGLGVTVVPRTLAVRAQGELQVPGLEPYRTFALTDAEAVHPVGLVFDPRRQSPAAREFRRLLAEA